MSAKWVEGLMDEFNKGAKPINDSDIPKGAKRCQKCGGTGVGKPGEKYYEMGTGTYGCSECHSFGYV